MIARSPLNVIDFHRPLFFLYFSFFFITFFYWVPLLIWKWVRHRHQRFVVFLRFEKQTNKWDLRDQVRPIQCFWNSSGTLEGPGWLIRWRAGRGNAEQRKKKVVPVPEWVCSTTSRAETAASIRQWSTRPRPDRTAETSVPGQPKSASGAVSVPKPALERRGGGPEETNAEPSKSRWQWSVSFSPIPFFFFSPKVFSCSFFFLWKKTLGKARRHLDDVMESVAGSGRAIAGEITEFSRCLSSSYRAGLFLLLCSNGFSWVLLGFARVKSGYYLVLTRFYRVFLGFTGFYRVLLVFTEFYWVLLVFFQV